LLLLKKEVQQIMLSQGKQQGSKRKFHQLLFIAIEVKWKENWSLFACNNKKVQLFILLPILFCAYRLNKFK